MLGRPAPIYYTDGTGGLYSSAPEARRCGVGIAYLQGLDLELACYLALPGGQQTVPASELFAVLLVVAMVPPATSLTTVVDSMYVRDAVRTEPRGRALANLWDRLWSLT